MKSRLAVLLLCAAFVPAAQARATILPDACGDDKVKFDVKTETSKTAPAAPEAGKAQIIFSGKGSAVIRYGVDGAWVGANKGNSYFAVTVDPGLHHLCAGWQSISGKVEKNIGVASFTAEKGKVYYFEAEAEMNGGGGGLVAPATGPGVTAGGGGYVGGVGLVFSFTLTQLDEDTGKYRVKAWKLATSKPKK